MSPHVTIAILAAGSSTRFGSPKQLFQYKGTSLLRRAAYSALSAGCPTLVITGASASLMKEELLGIPVIIVENELWREGVASSVRCAIQHLPTDTEAILIMTVDQPLVNAELLKKIVQTYHETGGPLVACRYAGTIGVPALYDSTLFPRLLALRGDVGAKPIIEQHQAEAHLIDAPDCAVDIDGPEDLPDREGRL